MNYFNLGFVVILVLHLTKGEDYEEVDYEGNDESTSVDSESHEVYNSSAWPRPRRVPAKGLLNEKTNSGGPVPTSLSWPDEKNLERKTSFPFSASIQKRNSHYSSGALINAKWLLSAAREFYNVRESIKLFRARLGTVNYKKGGVLVALKGIELHPLYTYRHPDYDLALLKLARPVVYTEHIKPIPVATSAGEIVGAKFFTTYWPRVVVDGRTLPASAKERVKRDSMRVSTQKLIPRRKCYSQMLALNRTLGDSSLCLEHIVSLHSPCMPDVGAPVIAHDLLWGVTSGWVSDNCQIQASPTLFTRLSEENVQFWLDSLRDP